MIASPTSYSSRNFIPTRASHPCPICEDIKSKCRIVSDEFVLCMTYPSDASILGWRYIGETQGSYYAGKYVAISTESTHEQQQQRETARRLAAARQKNRQAHFAQLPSIEQRDRQWQQYLAQLTLKPIDRDELYSRGFSDIQITAIGFKSVNNGYITPIRTPQGQIIGAQVRQRITGDGGRYRWHKPYGWDIHLPNGNVPIAFYLPFETDLSESPQQIVIVEGTGIKPARAADLLQCPAIGAAGGNFTASNQLLQEYLSQTEATPSTTRIAIALDAGDINNPAVMRRLQKNIALVKSLGYVVEVLWWNQFTKQDNDIDELSVEELSQIQHLKPEQFWQLCSSEIQTQLFPPVVDQFDRFADIFASKVQHLAKIFKGFGKAPGQSPTKTNCSVLEFEPGDRIKTYQQLYKQGKKYILDISSTGTGKSYETGLLPNYEFADIDQFFYVSNEHRNPTTATIETHFADLPVRHQGLKHDSSRKTPLGEDFLHHPKPGELPETSANCHRADLFVAMRGKNINLIGKDNPICKTCQFAEQCARGTGTGYGFRYERSRVLQQDKFIRASLSSLPTEGWHKRALIFDEAGKNSGTKKVTINLHDLDAHFAELGTNHPELFAKLHKGLTAMRKMLTGDIAQPSSYGWHHTEIKAELTDCFNSIGESDLSELFEFFHPDFSHLEKVDRKKVIYSKDANISQSTLRYVQGILYAEMQEETKQELEATTRKVKTNWLIPLIEVLTQRSRGAIIIANGQLTLTLPDTQLHQMVHNAGLVVFQDATAQVEQIVNIHAIKSSEIAIVRQKEAQLNNLKTVQVVGLGKLSKQRREGLIERVQILIEALKLRHPDTAVVDFKKYDAEGAWFIDSRGYNAFESRSTLCAIGTPHLHLGDVLSNYIALTGKEINASDAEFQKYYKQLTDAEIIQVVGRLRANRRPDEQLTCYLITDEELPPEITSNDFEQVLATDIATDAGYGWLKLATKIRDAITELNNHSIKLTQQAIAEATEVTQGTISKLLSKLGGSLEDFEKLFQTFISSFISTWNNVQLDTKIDEPAPEEIAEVLQIQLGQEEIWQLAIQTFSLEQIKAAAVFLTDDIKPKFLTWFDACNLKPILLFTASLKGMVGGSFKRRVIT